MRPLPLGGALCVALLLAGCTTPPAAPAPPPPVPTTGAFSVNWSVNAYGFHLQVDGPQPQFDVQLTDLTGGAVTHLPADAVRSLGGGRFAIAPQPLAEGHRYRIEALAHGSAFATRSFATSGSGFDQPDQLPVQATYDLRLDERDSDPDAPSTLHIVGTGLVKSGTATTFRMAGTGTATQSAPDYTMALTVSDFLQERNGDDLVQGRMAGTGTMTFRGSGPTGSGTVDQMKMDFLGYEDKADGSGATHRCEKDRLEIQAHGTLTSDGQSFTFVMHQVETDWKDAKTGDPVWQTTTGTMTVTDAQGGEHPTPLDSDGPAQKDATDKPSLEDDADWQGLIPVPVAAGDLITQAGKHGLQIQYVAVEGGQESRAGQDFNVIHVTGTPTGGASGSETIDVVKDGVYAGLPLAGSRALTRATETLGLQLTLTSLV